MSDVSIVSESDDISDEPAEQATFTDQPSTPDDPRGLRRFKRTMWWTASLVTVPYICVLWNFTFRPFRRAYENGLDSGFFDLQARAIMHGRLNVPAEPLGIEAFTSHGKTYTYFPPFPSFIRIPFLMFTNRFDGWLSAPSMFAAWVITLLFTALLLWRVRCIMRPDAPLSRLEAGAYAALFVAMTAGTVILYLASMPWVFHEVYAWSVALSLGTIFFFLGALTKPTWRNILGTGAFATMATLTRATVGWALAIAILLAALWSLFGWRGGTTSKRHGLWLGATGAIAIFVGGAFNYAKFHNALLFPIANQRWTVVNAHRRAALAANGGDLFNPNMIWSTAAGYLRPDGIRFTPVFPFLSLPADPARSYGGGFLDQSYRTGSVTAFMPLLVMLCLWGVWVTFRPRRKDDPVRDRIAVLRFPLLGTAAILFGIMFYAYIAHRYTTEFMPLLMLGSAIGACDLFRRIAGNRRRERVAVGVFAGLAFFALAANSAVSVTTERQAYSGQPLRQYVIYQKRISDLTGHPLDSFVSQSDTLEREAQPDELRILGDCDALWMSNGDEYNSWVPVEARDRAWNVTIPPAGTGNGEPVELLTFDGWRTWTVRVQQVGDHLLRVSAEVPGGPRRSAYVGVEPGATYPLVMKSDPYGMRWVMEWAPKRFLIDVPMVEFAPDWQGTPQIAHLNDNVAAETSSDPGSLQVTPLPTSELTFCESLQKG